MSKIILKVKNASKCVLWIDFYFIFISGGECSIKAINDRWFTDRSIDWLIGLMGNDDDVFFFYLYYLIYMKFNFENVATIQCKCFWKWLAKLINKKRKKERKKENGKVSDFMCFYKQQILAQVGEIKRSDVVGIRDGGGGRGWWKWKC